MHFFTNDECIEWTKGNGWQLDETLSFQSPSISESEEFIPISFLLPTDREDLYTVCRVFIDIFFGSQEWLLLPQDISYSMNLHLYYRFRQSYGDRRSIGQAPGHFFFDYEQSDLFSFLELAFLNNWTFDLLAAPSDRRAYHQDTSVIYYAKNIVCIDYAKEKLSKAKIKWRE